MTDFEKLQKLAKEEFDVTIVRSEKKSSFAELFGFTPDDLTLKTENLDGEHENKSY